MKPQPPSAPQPQQPSSGTASTICCEYKIGKETNDGAFFFSLSLKSNQMIVGKKPLTREEEALRGVIHGRKMAPVGRSGEHGEGKEEQPQSPKKIPKHTGTKELETKK